MFAIADQLECYVLELEKHQFLKQVKIIVFYQWAFAALVVEQRAPLNTHLDTIYFGQRLQMVLGMILYSDIPFIYLSNCDLTFQLIP